MFTLRMSSLSCSPAGYSVPPRTYTICSASWGLLYRPCQGFPINSFFFSSSAKFFSLYLWRLHFAIERTGIVSFVLARSLLHINKQSFMGKNCPEIKCRHCTHSPQEKSTRIMAVTRTWQHHKIIVMASVKYSNRHQHLIRFMTVDDVRCQVWLLHQSNDSFKKKDQWETHAALSLSLSLSAELLGMLTVSHWFVSSHQLCVLCSFLSNTYDWLLRSKRSANESPSIRLKYYFKNRCFCWCCVAFLNHKITVLIQWMSDDGRITVLELHGILMDRFFLLFLLFLLQ